ncbi:DEAD/DEAH box helicase [bacterium]|nr:DEAD/DEAH box helicase [bacterium]
MTTFKNLGLNPNIMESLEELGFVEPSPIQEKAIPFVLKSKKDLIALAQTGTGKTAAFALPILNQIKADGKSLQAIILCPTRELCLQISQDINKLAKHSKGVNVTPVYGGERIDIQIKALKRGTNIVVGTPGRVSDLIRRKFLRLQTIQWLVLDEADEMLDMGFKKDLDSILEETPKSRQTLLFSATISKSVSSIAKQYMKEAEEISVGTKNIGAENVSHEYYVTNTRDRFEALKRILDSLPGVYGILFCRTRRETQDIADKLKRANYDTEALHGDITQTMRTKIMDRFKRKHSGLLVATDVAARGIDINNLSHVINYNLPDQNEGYTHRSGRTGRVKQKGISISIITAGEVRIIRQLENIIGKGFEYKQIPNGKDVYLKQVEHFIEEIENTDTGDIDNDPSFSDLAKRLNKLNKDDLIKHLIANKFSHLTGEHKNDRDLNAKVRSFDNKQLNEDNVSLKINFGKNDRFDLKKLFALLNANKNLRGLELGRIDLMPEHSIFSVERKRANDVIKYLSGTNFKSKKIEITISNKIEKRSYSRNRRGRSGGGRSGGRRSGGRSSSRSGSGRSSGPRRSSSARPARKSSNFKRKKY